MMHLDFVFILSLQQAVCQSNNARARHLTTRTDYTNIYPSVLQISSYNFSSTNTTPEECVGVVKAPGTYPKNTTQHACDLEMLDAKNELWHVFTNMENVHEKSVDCIT